MTGTRDRVLELVDVELRMGQRQVLAGIDWTVSSCQRWVVLGPNGSGKTSLALVASLQRHPSSGTVTVLGEELGRTDVRALRARIGLVSAAMADLLRPALSARDAVMTARYGALEPWWHRYDSHDRTRVMTLLEQVGLADRADQTLGTLSSGERQRVLLARALMAEPALLIADEPHAGLDISAREDLVDAMDRLAADGPPIILVTHHVEEIPPSFTHLLALKEGRVVARGRLRDTLDASLLSGLFGIPIHLELRDRRYSARRA